MTAAHSARRLPPRAALATAGFALLALAFLSVYWWPQAKLLAGDEAHYHAVAQAILAGEDWFDRNLIWPPLQGVFLAAVYALAGTSLLTAQVLQLAMLAAAGLLLRRCLLEAGVGAATAGWAAVLLAVNPLTIAYATYLWPEIPHLFLSLVLALALLRARRSTRLAAGLAWAGLAGAALGLCLLAKSLLAGFWPLLLLPLAWRRNWRDALPCMLAFGAAALLVLAPALHRGWQETGRPMVADSSWFNLWVGLQDQWRSDLVFDRTGEHMARYLDSAEDHAGRTAFAREQALAIVAEQGLPGTLANQLGRQYFRLFDARSFPVAQLPGEPCRGYLSRYQLASPFWTNALDRLLRGWHLAVLALFAFGLTSWRDWRRPWLWLAGAFVGYQLALLGLLHVKTRFLLPMLPVLCLFGGHALARLSARPSGAAVGPPMPPGRWLAGAALAALLFALALAGPWLDQACA